MRILLIDPPFERFQGVKRCFFPLGLAYVAGHLHSLGHEVGIYDVEHSSQTDIIPYAEAARAYQKFLDGLNNPQHAVWSEVEAEISRFAPDLLGISCVTVKYDSALKIAAIAKKVNPQLKIAFGGCHPTLLPHKVLEQPVVDYVIRGEGEITLVELVAALEGRGLPDNPVVPGFIPGQPSGGQVPALLNQVQGLSYKQNGQVIHNPNRPLWPEIDKLAYPARHLLRDAKGYDAEDMGLIMGSRGCPYECTYCASQNMWGRKVRYRSADNILGEIRQVVADFGTTQFSFEDDSFTANKKLVSEFCQKIQSQGPQIKWSAITRINLLTDELLAMMKHAGCNHIRVGIESGSDKILLGTRKHLTVNDMIRGAKVLHRSGVYWSAYFMVGLPEETEEDILATINLMKQIQPDYATLSIFTPYPGTAIFADLLKSGLVSEEMNWSQFSHASPHNYFAPQIPKERFAELVNHAALEVDKHNGSLRRLLKRAKAKTGIYLQKPSELLADAKKYMSWRKGGS